MPKKKLNELKMQNDNNIKYPQVKLLSPFHKSNYRIIREPIKNYRFLSTQLCVIPPSKFFKMFHPYVCTVMTENHRAYKSHGKTKFVLFNKEITRGVSLTANTILQCFKPIPGTEDIFIDDMGIEIKKE
jgi:hypothetical protein